MWSIVARDELRNLAMVTLWSAVIICGIIGAWKGTRAGIRESVKFNLTPGDKNWSDVWNSHKAARVGKRICLALDLVAEMFGQGVGGTVVGVFAGFMVSGCLIALVYVVAVAIDVAVWVL